MTISCKDSPCFIANVVAVKFKNEDSLKLFVLNVMSWFESWFYDSEVCSFLLGTPAVHHEAFYM